MTSHELSLVVAAFSITGAVATVVIGAGFGALGVWFGNRVFRVSGSAGAPEVSLRRSLGRSRAQLRAQLTPGERRFFYGYMLISPLLVPLAIGLLVFGPSSTRAVGVGLLLVALVVMAVPISPLMRARIRRRGGPDSK